MGENTPHGSGGPRSRVLDGLLLAPSAASRLVGRRGRGHVGQLLRGRGQQIRCRDAHDGPVGLRKVGALERHLKLRPDGRGSGAGRRRRGPHDLRRQPEEVERELHPVLVLIVRSRARQQDLEADLGEIASRSWRVGPSGPARAAALALGARGSSRGTARTALPGGPRCGQTARRSWRELV